MNEALKKRAMNIDVALAVFCAAGVTAGVILSVRMDEASLISLGGAETKLALAADGRWLKLFAGSFFGIFAMTAVAFLCGFCAVAQPLELLLMSFRGLGLGICVRGIYLGNDVLRSMAVFLPFSVLSTGILWLASREAFTMSLRYLELSSTNENRIGLKNEVRDYTTRFMIFVMMLAVLSCADAYLARAVSGL